MPQVGDVGVKSRERLKSKKEQGGSATVTAESTDTSATERERLTSGLGSGRAAKGGGDNMPKQEPGEAPAAFGARVAAWRRRKEAGVTMDNAAGALANKLR